MILKADNKLCLLRELQKGEEKYYIYEPEDFFIRKYNAIKLNDIRINNIEDAERVVSCFWGESRNEL